MMIGKMTMFVSVLLVVGPLIWALRTKKYFQALFVLVALANIDLCIIAVLFVAESRFWHGPLLIAIGLDALLAIAIVIKRLFFCANKPAA